MTRQQAVDTIDEILNSMAIGDFRRALLSGDDPAVMLGDEQREKLIEARRALTE